MEVRLFPVLFIYFLLMRSFLVWSLHVVHRVGTIAHIFCVATDINWELFDKLARLYLRIDRLNGRLGCRVIQQQVPEELRRLRNRQDWEECMKGICAAAEQGIYQAIEIVNVSLVLRPNTPNIC